MACISEENAKPFINEKLSMESIKETPLTSNLRNFKDNIPTNRSFVSVVAVPLTNDEKKELKNWKGWDSKQIQQYTDEQQRQYYNQYKINRGYYGNQRNNPTVQADSVQITFRGQSKPTFAGYSSGIGTSYAIFHSELQICTKYYKTDFKPILYSAEVSESNAKLVYYLKNNSDFDGFSLAKDIILSNELSVVSEALPNGLNIYWKPIDQAVHYYVELFKAYEMYSNGNLIQFSSRINTVLFDTENRKMVYFVNGSCFNLSQIRYMYKERIDREKCFFAQPFLASGSYLARVSAENRVGDVIAKSYAVPVTVNTRT
ncbi:MAG: hypothetical protein U1C51_09755, partial [Candidatus Izemoplasmatales bacterium]|nr:hypothetical protein [Candidatus Izemoplasmatales bacterium]